MAASTPDSGTRLPLQTKLMADINITPMVDVMLVLLVIFMVTAPLLVAGVRIDLPRNAAPKISHLQKPVIVTLTADGSLYLGDDPVERPALAARLSLLRTQDGDAVVYLRADKKIAYGEVVALLGQVGNAGYQRISLLSQFTEGAPSSPDASSTPSIKQSSPR
jgi:biopolymer transport protein ExbD